MMISVPSLYLVVQLEIERDVVAGGGERSVALTAGKNCGTLKDPEKHRPAKENNIICISNDF